MLPLSQRRATGAYPAEIGTELSRTGGWPDHGAAERRVFEANGSAGAWELSPRNVLLTVKLRGRPKAPDQAPWAHNLFRARGADTHTVHGPLQRLLEVTLTGNHCARAAPTAASEDDIASGLSAPSAGNEGDPPLARSAQARLLPGKSALARAPASIEATVAARARGLGQAKKPAGLYRPLPLPHPGGQRSRLPPFFAESDLPKVTSNGEVEGPPWSARLEPRVHTVFPHPRRHYRPSRTPPTIVRRRHRADATHQEACQWRGIPAHRR